MSPPRSMEAALLRFFDFLAFHNFASVPIFMNEDNVIEEKQIVSLIRVLLIQLAKFNTF